MTRLQFASNSTRCARLHSMMRRKAVREWSVPARALARTELRFCQPPTLLSIVSFSAIRAFTSFRTRAAGRGLAG